MRLLARSRGLAAGPGARHLSARKRPRKGSKAWLDRHVNDGFVKAAQKQGWRSRAAFKLLEMHEKHGLLAPGATIVELGCAPGGWTQVAASKLGPGGLVVGIDLLEVAALSGGNSRIIQGDFTEAEAQEKLRGLLAGREVDLVLSDMAPNTTGDKFGDHARSLDLVYEVLEFAAPLFAQRKDRVCSLEPMIRSPSASLRNSFPPPHPLPSRGWKRRCWPSTSKAATRRSSENSPRTISPRCAVRSAGEAPDKHATATAREPGTQP
uniref:rRNA methyltransferase 2, mitochondrial n=1 Tax=Phaeomonas parva TaxID=124430 RepID=A0A7S1TYC7_9STRA|mmetsp:Transcript_22804/g.70658  ORF Transcript_22804/g.70658 Transcript_22804/m.70658 type:complete len:265 (+) Transcript_22804:81-875(+)